MAAAPPKKRPEKPLAIVTGASRGIGAALACNLGAAGYHVVLVARTEAGLAETEDKIHQQGGTATIAPLDLEDGEAIDKLAAVVAERWGRVDLLALNAATLGTLSPVAHSSPAEFERVIRLNIVAQWRLLRDFDAMLRHAKGTLVTMTSSVGATARAYWGAYSISKAAFDNLARIHAAETQAFGLKTLIVDPGATRTRMRARAFPGEDPQTLKTAETVAERVATALGGIAPGLTLLKLDRDGAPRLYREDEASR